MHEHEDELAAVGELLREARAAEERAREAVRAAVIAAVAAGMSPGTAARLTGVSRPTAASWVREGTDR